MGGFRLLLDAALVLVAVGVTLLAARAVRVVRVVRAVRAVRVARAEGAASERARLLRTIHDTVLQTLEAMALTPDGPRAEATVAELRTMARGEAVRLRRLLSEVEPDRRPRLADVLDVAVADATTRGLRVTLVAPDLGEDGLTPARREALRDAAREALSNAARHSGVAEAVVRIDAVDEGVEVIVRDHGCGFVVAPDRFGFGIRESLINRMGEAGGRATIESEPGAGTRVRLWVPA